MRSYNLTKKEGKVVAETQQALYRALFDSVNFPRNLSIFLVGISLFMATLVLHEGWFPTSQSQGMSNYHRWLYDVYVTVSIFIVPLIYLRFKQLEGSVAFRRKWNAYIRAYAQYQFKLKQVVESVDNDRSGQQKLSDSMTRHFLKHPWFQYLMIGVVIYGCIAMYIWVTPFTSSRGSSFWILAWWPINAVIIGMLYYIQFPLMLRWLSIAKIQEQYGILQLKAVRENSVNNMVEKIPN
ncbi:hypothetical protein [Acinetobacter schindleri]|uniref:hypothetical protein n=1 Tax=Acinetobacter schindleri TaxID=108981 RepID=UPI002FDE4AFA